MRNNRIILKLKCPLLNPADIEMQLTIAKMVEKIKIRKMASH